MGVSIFIARILGPYCLIVALGGLLNLKTYQRVIDECVVNAAMVYIGGILALFFGLLILQCNNIWTFNWRVIITIMGWSGLIKGMYLIFFPNSLIKVVKFYQKFPIFLASNLILVLVLGVILTAFGYRGL
jgi:hypothetical protein